jgi:uncharacterized UPF0160 family protein
MKKVEFKGFKSAVAYTYNGDYYEDVTPFEGQLVLRDILTRKSFDYMQPDYKAGEFVPADLSDIGVVTIATHNGVFHADDVAAVASIAARLKRYGIGYEIVRTRDQKIIDIADVVVDVGGVYDPENLRFDHHQDGELLSSIGLLNEDRIGTRIFDDDIIKQIDDHDRGIANHADNPFIRFVMEMNPLDISKSDEAFNEAVEFVIEVFEKYYRNKILSIFEEKADELAESKQLAITKFKESIRGLTPDSDGIFFFDKSDEFLPFWKDEINGLKHPEARWVIYWDKVQQLWTIQVVPTDPQKPFEFPEQNSLLPLKGEKGVIFVHKNGFIAKVKDWRRAVARLKWEGAAEALRSVAQRSEQVNFSENK